MDPSTKAAANRAIRTILNELEFLSDTELVSVEQYATIKSLLPTPSSGPGTAPTKSTVDPTLKSGSDVTSNLDKLSLAPPNNDRPASRASNVSTAATLNSNYQQRQDPSPAASGRARPPPPPATLATASALYAYAPTDPGDLAIAPGDQLVVTEFMNADWAKGRNERTGQEGIFPRSYVRINEDKPQNFGQQQQQQYGYYNEKQQPQMQQQQQGYYPNNGQGTPYGNMPVQVAQGQPQEQVQTPPPGKHATASGLGMKFGRKLGNAAIFGAGATLGSDLVNSII